MEKVQFQLESTLPELKDFHDKGLFTKNEIDQITRRRTVFETSLIRRHTRKDDFFKYAEYEINLERLRKVRWKKLGYHINPPPPSASSYSLPRRAIYILKRATVKFPGDLAVWLAYVEYASREGMRKIVSKGLTLALQHHPLSPTLYLLLSYHHLHPNSPFPREVIPSASTLDLPSTSSSKDTGFSLEGTAAARTQLLLGLRLIPDSEILWMEYIKLELGWVEALRRRWNVLGINDAIDSPDSNEVNAERMTGGEGSFGPDGEDARKSILAGQLVLHAIRSALGAIEGQKGMTFRLDLVRMLRTYPSALRGKALDAVHEDLGRIAEGSDMKLAAQARLAGLTRGLYERKYVPGETDNALEGVELVEELGRIAKEIRRNAKEGSEFLEVAGEWLGEQIEAQKDNEDLVSE
ncbi:U3 small nucleolar RNA-associated protein 6-domain-containing protein [Papiliotrema laurentii]|uniref:U3 small nucleolar RNA-associated protein 6-domain-containing protein n=1 Tax=Papiliotrema laurentii TaxID=5418 RepID=A0AAD9FRZ1_PAPLA|nr:U3 small nucleolar RNA-associated protein 6-domain-containing protein [Papiliotrema laurentii]